MATAKKSAAKKGAAKKGGTAAKKGGAAAKKSAAKKGGASASKGSAAKKGGSAAKKAPAKKAASKRKPNPAFMKPMTPSPELAAVIGNKPMPRSEVAKQMWVYIRKNGLQDQQNKRQINADDNLRAVFGGKKSVSMFDMTKLVNQHLRDS
jgi:chromatin remodeling complex protein RSC6